MRTSSMWIALILGLSVAASLVGGGNAKAQGQQATPVMSGADDLQTELHMLTDVQRQSVDNGQAKAYKAFYKVALSDPDNKIQMGNEFLKQYPKSPLDEAVEVGLTSAYYAKQDWSDFYSTADQVLALNPNEVDILTTVGWVIPHEYDPNDANAGQLLDKAESDENHALDVLAKMPKPKGVSDEKFAAMKAQKEQQAHSALGLVYFRRGDYARSVNELQQSTKETASPDQTDFYVLGVDLQNLNRQADAAAAFTRCSQMSGPMQSQCQKEAGPAKK
ncbi:MAG: tetratricopeptide repeat protein [Candidatus Acidiferrales bacterium]